MLTGVRRRRDRVRERGAATLLLLVMAAHALRETARDTLFLSHLPAAMLPWSYLAIAVLALGAGLLGGRLLGTRSHRRLLAATLLLGAAVDVVFWWAARDGAQGALFALYVWTGLLATAVTVQFWLHMADVFDVGEAKTSFPWIAAGGLAGAVLGSSLASVLVLGLPVRSLLLGASLLFAASSLVCQRLPARRRDGHAPAPGALSAEPSDTRVRTLLASPYLRRVVALVTLTAVLGTGVDYVFKTVVAAEVPRARLGDVFARVAAGVNLAALLFQLLVAPILLQALGVIRAVAVLPALLAMGAGAVALLGGLAPALALRGIDGTLRHSLHRAGTEILHLPVEPAARAPFKTIVDSLGQRGGQALASLAILAAVAWQAPPRAIGAALAVVAVAALACLIGLRREYVARFRAQLRALDPDTRAAVPRLDLHSLEALVASLSAPNDAEVLSALDLLESYGRAQLIPPLILHHPSRAVVLRALELFAGSRHVHVGAAIEQLLSHRDPEVRAAAVTAIAARTPDGAEAVERLLREDSSDAVRVAALVASAGRQADASQLARLANAVLGAGGREARIALARALPLLPYPRIAPAVRTLIAHRDPTLAAELARAVAADPDPRQLPLLVALLARREARATARAVLLALGDTSLLALTRAERRADTPDAVRRQLSRTIARFASPLAVAPLLEALAGDDPRLRHRALRGLGRLRAQAPGLEVPSEPLLRLAQEALERAITLVYYRAVHETWHELHPPAPDPGADLLVPLLIEKTERALERVFRTLHVLAPQHDYAVLFRALRRGGASSAGSRELLEHLVDEDGLRDGLLALLDGDAPLEQLRCAAACFAPAGAERLLALLPRDGRAKDLTDPARAELEELASAVFVAVQQDRDAVLASVACRHHARMRGGSADGERIDGDR